MTKIFVLDTNVLLHEPGAVLRFDDNEVVLPIYVVEELDQFKKDQSNLGRNARECSRILDGLRADGRLSDGVDLANGGRLRVAFVRGPDPDETVFARQHVYDNLILRCALARTKRATRAAPCSDPALRPGQDKAQDKSSALL